MKVLPAFFFSRYSGLAVTATFLAYPWAKAHSQPAAGSGLPPGAVQSPQYRQSGSAFVAPGAAPRTAPPRQASLPPTPQGYQPGFGTPPARSGTNYRPPGLHDSAPQRTSPPSGAGKAKPVTLESKVARLERNDLHQDRRLNSLERGNGAVSPTIEGTSAPHAPVEGKLYVVRSGDTLWGIASKHGTSINALKAANHLSRETIAVGQSLVIPGQRSATGSASPTSSATATAYHIVRPGDTFTSLSRRYSVSQDALARANPSAYPDRLLVGEKLTIPGVRGGSANGGGGKTAPVLSANSSASAGRTHVVKKGESLGAIAKSHGVSTASMVAANKLKNANHISPGMRLKVPGGHPSSPAAPAPAYPPADSDTSPLPDVRLMAATPSSVASKPEPQPAPPPAPAGDTFAEPASRPISKPIAQAGGNRRGIIAYRIEQGDDLQTVAALFNTTPEVIREKNPDKANRKLQVGDELIVPSLGAVSLN